MRYSILICIGFFFAVPSLKGQVGERLNEVGINMTSLVSQLLPFQNSTTLVGPFHFQFKGGRNNRYFSLKLGAQVRDFEAGNFLNIAIGYNRRRQIGEKFDLDIGYHLMILGGSFNDPVNSDEIGGLGLSWDIGFKYRLNSRMSIGAGTILFIGPTSNAFSITFVPPVGLFLIGRLK